MSRNQPLGLGEILDKVLRSLGAGDFQTWRRIEAEWLDLAGEPWRTHAKPVALTGSTLVVEATSQTAVSLLRYGAAGLIQSLDSGLGVGRIKEVRVRPPVRRNPA